MQQKRGHLQQKGGMKNENSLKDRKQISDTSPGTLVWGKLGKFPWWPGMIVDPAECIMTPEGPGHVCVYWLYDSRVTDIPKRSVVEFQHNFNDFFEGSRSKSYNAATVIAIEEIAKRMNIDTDEWTAEMCLTWAKDGFPNRKSHRKLNVPAELIPDFVREDLRKIKNYKINKEELALQKKNSDSKISGKKRKIDSLNNMESRLSTKLIIENLQKIKQHSLGISAICLGCKSLQVELVGSHPIFEGSLCRSCKDTLQQSMITAVNGAHTACAICGTETNEFTCNSLDCKRVYCISCIELLGGDDAKNKIDKTDHWKCFVCNDYNASINGLIVKRVKDKRKCNELATFFLTFGHIELYPTVPRQKEEINVLSLFDGIATGLLVLQKLGFKVNRYFAAEIHDDAIKVSCVNHLESIEHVGDVRLLTKEKLKGLGKIDLLIGGSPCGELSLVNPARKGLYDPEATGILFFEFCRILRELQGINRKSHLFWLYENTATMPLTYRQIISRNLGSEAVLIDAAWFSAQKRARYFWGNIPELGKSFNINTDEHTLNNFLDPGLHRVATVKKLRTVTTQSNSLYKGKSMEPQVIEKGICSALTSTELERIFGFPVHYTDVANLSAQKRQKLLGRAWSVQVISHILKPLKPYFLSTEQ